MPNPKSGPKPANQTSPRTSAGFASDSPAPPPTEPTPRTESAEIVILHLSDLHFGSKNRFGELDPGRLGGAFGRAITAAMKALPINSKLSFVFITGDLTEKGHPREFAQAELFLSTMASQVGVPHARVLIIPGNHDISWPECMKVEQDQQIEEFDELELGHRLTQVKLRHYERFLISFYGRQRPQAIELPGGGRLFDFGLYQLSVAGLNTCTRESHRYQDHVGALGLLQSEKLLQLWTQSGGMENYDDWLKIVLVHHNPVATTPKNIEAWRASLAKRAEPLTPDVIERYVADVVGFQDAEQLRMLASDARVHLILHGHHHDQGLPVEWPWKQDGRCAVLSTGSWGLKPECLPTDTPPSCQLIHYGVASEQQRLEVYPLVYDSRFRIEGELLTGAFALDRAAGAQYSQELRLPKKWLEGARIVAQSHPRWVKTTSFEQAYRQRAESLFADWDLRNLGIAQAGGTEPMVSNLEEIYQPLHFAKTSGTARTATGLEFTPDALAKLTYRGYKHPTPMMMRGPAGSGKTTWMRYTFRRLITRDDVLPIMVALRDVARDWQREDCRGAARSIDTFLDNWVTQHVGEGYRGGVGAFLRAQSGPAPIILVDGWDELGPLGIEFREKLLGFMRSHPHVLVIVSSRPAGEGRFREQDGFAVHDIQPFSRIEIAAFAERFFKLCYRADPAAAERELGRFQAALDRSPEAATLAQTPLLLTMMLLVSRSEQLPDKRHLLYEKCIYNLLTSLPDRRKDSGALVSSGQWCPEDSEERKRSVARLAFAVQTSGYDSGQRSASPMTWQQMEELLPPEPLFKRHSFLKWLVESTGLLTDRSDGTLVFSHLSFQEYLTAWHLNALKVEQLEVVSEFQLRIQQDTWWETLLLWSALISASNPVRLDSILDSLGTPAASFVGMVLADGLGSSACFKKWFDSTIAFLSQSYPVHFRRCVSAWKSSRQDARKSALREALQTSSTAARVCHFFRLNIFHSGLFKGSLDFPHPSALSVAFHECMLQTRPPSQRAVAVARSLAAVTKSIPRSLGTLGFLHAWPGRRRRIGIILQVACLAGAERRHLTDLAANCAQDGPSAVPSLPLETLVTPPAVNERGMTLDPIYNWFYDLMQPETQTHTATAIITQFTGSTPREPVPWLVNLANLLQALHLPPLLVLPMPGGDADTRESLFLREVFGKAYPGDESSPSQCREFIETEGRNVGIFWKSLAATLKNVATAEQKAHLAQAISNPESCLAPLSWGVQFFLRGDILLPDGEVVSLDELCRDAGVEPPPLIP